MKETEMAEAETPRRPTPQLTPHARQRCREMGLRTKEVKRVVQEPEIAYAGSPVDSTGEIATVSVRGDLAVVHVDDLIITVLWHKLSSRDRVMEFLTALP